MFSSFKNLPNIIFAHSVTDLPGAVGMCHDKAFLPCGPPLLGCSWEDTDENQLHSFAHVPVINNAGDI